MSCERFESGESLILEVYAHFGGEFEGLPGIGVSIVRNDGIEVYTTSSTMDQKVLRRVRPEEYLGKVEFRNLPLLSD